MADKTSGSLWKVLLLILGVLLGLAWATARDGNDSGEPVTSSTKPKVPGTILGEHIPVFLASLPGEHAWSERRIGFIREPRFLQSWAVQFGRYVAFLPKAGDTEFYARMAEDAQARKQSRFTSDTLGWPRELSFGLVVT